MSAVTPAVLVAAVLAALTVAAPARAQDAGLPLVPPHVPWNLPERDPGPAPRPAPEPRRVPADAERAPKLPEGLSVRGALRRAYLTGRADRATRDTGLRAEEAARRALRRLSGARGAGLQAALTRIHALAAERRLTPSRLRLAVLTMRANVTAWLTRPLPRPRDRMVFEGAVLQYVPGSGWQHHPLAAAGRANALARPCLTRARRALAAHVARAGRAPFVMRAGEQPIGRRGARLPRGPRCREAALRRALDALSTVAVRRGDFVAWEYLFPFGPGGAPWISAMAQGTVIQALARGAEALGEQRWTTTADAALRAFDIPPPTGLRLGPGRYAMYSQQPGLDVLNGFLQSIIALHDHAELTGSRRSARLAAAGERAARATVPAFDTGAWSLYSRSGRESTLEYHRLVTDFLDGLCRRTGRRVYCSAARRFAFYELEPPALGATAPRRARAERPVTLWLSVSKASAVTVDVHRGGRRVLRRALRVPRGRHAVSWTPARHGRHDVRIAATGPEGRTSRARVRFGVRESLRRIEARRRREAAELRRRAEARAERRREAAERRQKQARAQRRYERARAERRRERAKAERRREEARAERRSEEAPAEGSGDESASGAAAATRPRTPGYSSAVRSGARSSGSASSISLVKMRSERL